MTYRDQTPQKSQISHSVGEVGLNIDTIRSSFELRCIWKIAMTKKFEVRDPATGEVRDIDVASIDEDTIYPLKAYLGELPAYDITLDWNQQRHGEYIVDPFARPTFPG
jgi:intracellular multiplication protein IcmO